MKIFVIQQTSKKSISVFPVSETGLINWGKPKVFTGKGRVKKIAEAFFRKESIPLEIKWTLESGIRHSAKPVFLAIVEDSGRVSFRRIEINSDAIVVPFKTLKEFEI